MAKGVGRNLKEYGLSRKNDNFFPFIYFLAVLSLHCCAGFSLVVGSGGYSLVPVLELLIVVDSLVVEHGL